MVDSEYKKAKKWKEGIEEKDIDPTANKFVVVMPDLESALDHYYGTKSNHSSPEFAWVVKV